MKLKDSIVKFLKEEFNLTEQDIENMSLEELKRLKTEVKQKREEYFQLEMAMKRLGNAAYGAAANQYFYFYNCSLAADITGECRNLTKTMWRKLEEFFHEELWERKDVQEQFGFELDESKHDWYRKQPVSIYSDTDSNFKNSLLLVKDNKNNVNKITIESLFNEEFKKNGLLDITNNNQEIVECNDYNVLNWTEDKKLNYVPVKYIMRHKVSKPKFKIKTKSGKEVIVTGDHSCIVFRNNKKTVIKAKDINKDTDRILSIIDNEEK